MTRVERALVSVSDKSGLESLAEGLQELAIEVISTGGTARAIREFGLDVRDVSDVTGFPESPDGLVKTLHPRIHGAWLLNDPGRGNYMKYQEDNGISPIQLVVVNLYPFQETVANPDVTLSQASEQIDIGGPSMVRSAAKAGLLYGSCAVVVEPDDYHDIIKELKENGCSISAKTQRALSEKAFRHTRDYDTAICQYLEKR